jgi:hypothetical protein
MLSPFSGSLLPLGSARRGGASSPLLAGLALYAKLNEASGDAADSGPNGLTLANIGSVGYAAGLIGNAASFDGTARYLATADTLLCSHETGLAVSVWVKPANTTGVKEVIAKDGYTSNREWIIYLNGTSVVVELRYNAGGSTITATATSAVSAGNWSHVIATLDPADKKARLYINDGSANVSAGTLGTHSAVSTKVSIGRRPGLATFPFNGLIDEPGIWTGRVFTPAERTSLFNSGAGRTHPFS